MKFHWKSEATIFFSFLVAKWLISTSNTKDYHVIHQIEVNEPWIIIKIILVETFHS